MGLNAFLTLLDIFVQPANHSNASMSFKNTFESLGVGDDLQIQFSNRHVAEDIPPIPIPPDGSRSLAAPAPQLWFCCHMGQVHLKPCT